jgi:hypothetical protein
LAGWEVGREFSDDYMLGAKIRWFQSPSWKPLGVQLLARLGKWWFLPSQFIDAGTGIFSEKRRHGAGLNCFAR